MLCEREKAILYINTAENERRTSLLSAFCLLNKASTNVQVWNERMMDNERTHSPDIKRATGCMRQQQEYG